MGGFMNRMREAAKKGDMILLALCVIASLFGIVLIAGTTTNATASEDTGRYILIQSSCLIAGIFIYFLLTTFDIDILASQRAILFAFNTIFILMLLVWGVQGESGNRSWLHFPFLPFNIQPAEVVKLTYILILAKSMSLHQTRISSPRNVVPLTLQMIYIVVLIVGISSDTGVALIFIFIFIAMAFVGGVGWYWFAAAIAALGVSYPYLWKYAIRTDQKNRILALYDPTIDPDGLNEMWQTNQNLKALRNGGLTGQGLGKGSLTNVGALPARHTDSIFSATGEQLGMVGCILMLILLIAIVARVIYVAARTPDFTNRMICVGIASMFIFQILINIGVCVGLVPVIGLALPFFSYGGSSIITSFMAVGIVSGIRMRPSPDINAHYIRPY